MSGTTDHPLARNAVETLNDVSLLLAKRWEAGVFGVPEAVAEVTKQDTLTRIIVERALTEAGIDVWWNDLLCRTAVQAANAVFQVRQNGVDLVQLYGRNWDPIVGILKAAVTMDSRQLSACGYQLQGDAYSVLYANAFEQARVMSAEQMMQRVLSDVLFACHKDTVTTPAAHERLLHGARVLELAAAWYVLDGEGMTGIGALLEPIKRALWPHLPNLKGGL